MMQRHSIAAAVAASLGLMALAACGDRSTESTITQTDVPVAAESAAPSAPPPSFAAQHEMALTGMGAQITEQGLVVPLSDEAFAVGSAEFKPQSAERLEHVAGLLKERSNLRLEVVAYGDARGSEAANKRLAEQRAQAVEKHLISEARIADERIEAKGMGKAEAAEASATAEAAPQNHRVELVIVDQAGTYQSVVRNPGNAGAGAEPSSTG